MTYDLESLRLLSWLALGLVATGFALVEGVSLGLAMISVWLGDLPVARQRLTQLSAPISFVGFAWLLLLLSALFAVWPIAYAVALSSLRPALLLLVLATLLRSLAVSFYASSLHRLWLAQVDRLLLVGGWMPAILWGLLVGNTLKGIPFHLESDMRISFLGDFMMLLNPFALLVASCTLALLVMYAASYGLLKFSGDLQQRVRGLQWRAAISFIMLFALTGLWVSHLEGYHISSEILPNASSNPLGKFVKRGEGLWLDNYEHLPALMIIPGLAFCGAIASIWLSVKNRHYFAMLASSVTLAMAVWTAYMSMFPFLLPSNLSLNSSLTLWDSSASLQALQIVLPVIFAGLPVLMLASRWLFGYIAVDLQPSAGCENLADESSH